MKRVLLSAILILAPSLALAAGPQAGRLSGSLSIGVEPFGSGDLHGGAGGRAPRLEALNPALPAVPADLNIQSRSYGDVYDSPLTFGAELSYGLSDSTELFGALSYSSADEGRVQVGNAFVPALNATLPIFGAFGELTSWSLEGGARYYFAGETFRPFVGGRLGFARQEAVAATFTIPSAPAGGITLRNVPFFDDTTSLTAGAEAGIAFGLGEGVTGSASVGARYVGEFDGNDSALGGLGLASINDGTDRVTFPIQARISLTF
jgi:hypothetical protein